jgi:hypothetical protein
LQETAAHGGIKKKRAFLLPVPSVTEKFSPQMQIHTLPTRFQIFMKSVHVIESSEALQSLNLCAVQRESRSQIFPRFCFEI